MSEATAASLSRIVDQAQGELLKQWVAEQAATRGPAVTESISRQQSQDFLPLFVAAAEVGDDIRSAHWEPVLELLRQVVAARTELGANPTSIAGFMLSLKRPLFGRLKAQVKDTQTLADAVDTATAILDGLALYTTEVFQDSREQVIRRQQAEMMELSTPVVKLWEGILALPMIGTLDSERTQTVTENLLNAIIRHEAEIAILDITGVPMVDTLTAQHLLKTVAAARLMGADCIISGIRPQIAQTIVHLGVDLSSVTTKASLADALAAAMRRLGLRVTKVPAATV